MTTPSSERLHIAVVGRRNSGKSSLINAMTGQAVSLVSDVPGTTTDPVKKPMEVPGLGPCVFIDTAGFDDGGELGHKRVESTEKAVGLADAVILLFRAPEVTDLEATWFNKLKDIGMPVIPVLNSDVSPKGGALAGENAGTPTRLQEKISRICAEEPLVVNAASGEGVTGIFDRILIKLPEDFGRHTITGGVIPEGGTVLLVMPQDSQAPKGRLILPQVQTIRELLDRRCTTVCCTPDTMKGALERMASVPDLIITDSQAFEQVWKARPEGSRITSLSILYAAYKGDIRVFTQGAKALESLSGDSRILIAEACTHAPDGEDIGRVKIPSMLKKHFGESISVEVVSGNDFPEDLSCYSLIIHCGACMFNRRYVLNRIEKALRAGVPVTNYGMAIAWATGILDKVIIPGK